MSWSPAYICPSCHILFGLEDEEPGEFIVRHEDTCPGDEGDHDGD